MVLQPYYTFTEGESVALVLVFKYAQNVNADNSV